jgi:ABC-type nitrate/sulfonate/bicarbonate transport system substrate-binding protein
VTPKLRIACFAIACLLIAAGHPVSAQQPDTVRVDLVRDDAPMLALLTAKDAGFYARENLDVLVTGKGRAQEISGPQLRLWHVGLADVILSNRVAQDLRLIALTSRRLTGVAASIILIEEKSDILTRFLRATVEGNYLALREPAHAKKVLARDAGIKGARAIDASYRDFQAQSLPDMDISVASVQSVLKAGKIGLDAGVYVDGSLLAELRASGFFETLQKKYGKL